MPVKRLISRRVAAFSEALEKGHPQPNKPLLMRGLSWVTIKNVENAIADF